MDRQKITKYRIVYILISVFLITGIITVTEAARPDAVPAAALREDMHTSGEAYPGEIPEGAYLRVLFDKIVYIDAGHGGIDGGADAGGVLEKDITLAVALYLYDIINSGNSGIHPVMSRYDDVFIHRHTRAEEGSGIADIIVSIHCNWFTSPAVYGLEVYYDRNQLLSPYVRFDITSRELAYTLQRNIAAVTGARDRGARDTTAFGTQFHLTTYATVPSVIVEMGFMSNPRELALLASPEYQMSMARGIYYGILEVFGLN